MSDPGRRKRCKSCGAEKPLEGFYRNPLGRQGRRPEWKECTNARRKVWYVRNREREIARVGKWQRENPDKLATQRRKTADARARKYRQWHLQKQFGLSLDDYALLLSQQGGRCATCRAVPADGTSLHVDHDHETGRVRGLLCMRCNNALGLMRESADVLNGAIEYLYLRDPDGLGQLAEIRASELIRTAPG